MERPEAAIPFRLYVVWRLAAGDLARLTAAGHIGGFMTCLQALMMNFRNSNGGVPG